MTAPSIPRAKTDWRKIWVDIALLALAVAFMLFCYRIDLSAGRADWFHRSGGVAVLVSGVLAYRSLVRHYKKFFNAEVRGHVLRTSRGQWWVDVLTLVLSVLGTAVWAYGDKLFGALAPALSNQAMQPTAGWRESFQDFMREFSMLISLALASGG